MKKKILAVVLAATMVIGSAISAFAASYTLAYDSTNEFDNPLKGTNSTEVSLEFTIKLDDSAAANGWDGVASFYNTETKGLLAFLTNPYVCYNSDGNNGNTSYLDYNQPIDAEGTSVIGGLKDGNEHTYSFTITASGISMSVDGNEVKGHVTGGEADYQEILDFVNSADKFYIGVGEAVVSFWNTEISTVSNVKINGTEVGVTDSSEGETTTEEETTAENNTTASTGDNAATTTGDVATIVMIVAMVGAAAALVVLKKRVTE